MNNDREYTGDGPELEVIDSLTLSCMDVEPTRFCVDTLLPRGFAILGGAPKVGKSWMAMQLCTAVASGLPLWGMKTEGAGVLYLSLEDNLSRLQARLDSVTENPSEQLFFSLECGRLGGTLCEEIRQFYRTHPNTRLVVIDTLQVARGNSGESNYASDYTAIRVLKSLADELNITILALHHLRKQGDEDPMNRLSGTTGITGAADCTFVLERDTGVGTGAVLHCAGRDIMARKLELEFEEGNGPWKLVADSLKQPKEELPEELRALVACVKEMGSYFGGNTELAQIVSDRLGRTITPEKLKRMMHRRHGLLGRKGVRFTDSRDKRQRIVNIGYFKDQDEDDGCNGCDGEWGPPEVPSHPS